MLSPNQLYHIYNQGNNRQKTFFDDDNYIFFLDKVRKYIFPCADIFGYCLMPNHFHFLIRTNEASCVIKKVGAIEMPALVNGFRNLESSYAQAINKRFKRTGSLFRQKTKFKYIKDDYNAVFCLHYIHQNPLKAGLAVKLEEWRYSSFAGYCEYRKGNLLTSEFAYEVLPIERDTFYEDSYREISRNEEQFFL
jgi:putative transposase